MRWGEGITLAFVKLYLKQECLWNPKHPSYKLKYIRDKSYTLIGSEFEAFSGKRLTIPEIKKKINALRSTYSIEVHKIMKKSSSDPMYEPSLIWFHEMDRCLKNVKVNSKQSIVTKFGQETEEMDSSAPMWLDLETTDDKMEAENPNPLSSQTDEELLENPEEIIIKNEQYEHGNFKKIKKKKYRQRSSYYIPYSNANEGEDEFDFYGKFIAAQLRKMNLQKALKLQLEIQSLVSEARISELP